MKSDNTTKAPARVFSNWQDVLNAPRSSFFRGRTADSVRDRSEISAHDQSGGRLRIFEDSLFTQSNARVLIGHAANGMFRMIALPTRVCPVSTPPAGANVGFAPGMYYRAEMPMYAGNLSYQIALEGAAAPVDLAADDRDNVTAYADHFIPMTRTRAGDLDVTIASIAPVAPDASAAPLAPAPLPGLPGAIYVLRLSNEGANAVKGKVILKADDMLVCDYEDTRPEMQPFKKPVVDFERKTLILSRPAGAVGVRLAGGNWTKTEAPFLAERPIEIKPGQELAIETHVLMGESPTDLMPALFELCLRPSLDWMDLTAAFWRERLGRLDVAARDAGDAGEFSRDVWIRCLFDNFNCLQTDAHGNLIAHHQGAPSHLHGVIWGIDVEPTVVSIAPVCPELARQALLFFMTRSQAPGKDPEHSTPIYVAPVILARKWLELTGDRDFFARRPEVMKNLDRIMAGLMAMRADKEPLFPSRYSSDGPVGRRYDYGTNVKVWYALDSFAFLLRTLGRRNEAKRYDKAAADLKRAIARAMVVRGPFGRQVSGGTNLGEDPKDFYKKEDELYYDGEDTSSMLAPIYGMCDFTDEPWGNYHRFARSLWCAAFDPEHETLRWFPREGSPIDGTAYFARIGGSVTRGELRESLEILRRRAVSDVTGSVHWWPLGTNRKNGLTRCSQGQGAWAWQYLQQWLGLHADATSRTLTFAPRGLLTAIAWQGAVIGRCRFDLSWKEDKSGAEARIRNRGDEAWRIRVGFRAPGTGATGRIAWQTKRLAPGAEATLRRRARLAKPETDMDSRTIAEMEVKAKGDAEGVLFAPLGGHGLFFRWEERRAGFVRLLALNNTSAEWTDARVKLIYPDGWLAQWRESGLWTPPDKLAPSPAWAELGTVPKLRRAVAPFWVKAPEGVKTESSKVVFTAELTAQTAKGKKISRTVEIVVRG